jgi:Zinc carboxypeptidase
MDCWTKYIFIALFNVDGLDGFYHVHSVDDDIFKLQAAMESGSLDTDENIAIWHRYTKAKLHRKTMAPNTVRCNAATSWVDIGVGVQFLDQFPPFNRSYCIEHYFGTDLNRNFPSHWMGIGAHSNIFDDAYAGLYAGDQIETQNYMKLMQDLHENGTVLTSTDIHCCGDMWLLPGGWHPCKIWDEDAWACVETYGESLDAPVAMEWGKVVTDAIFQVNGNQFTYGPVTTTIYPAAGSGMDWLYETFGSVYLGSPEIHRDSRGENFTALYEFSPPNENILPAIQEVYAGMVAGVQFALDNPNKRVSDLTHSQYPFPDTPWSTSATMLLKKDYATRIAPTLNTSLLKSKQTRRRLNHSLSTMTFSLSTTTLNDNNFSLSRRQTRSLY